MINVSLRAKVIPENHNVYIIHPGRSKLFYETFLNENVVFLDYPAFEIPEPHKIGLDENDESSIDRAILASISRSEKIKRWYQRDAPIDEQPDRDLSSYVGGRITKARSRSVNQVRELYQEANIGDIVVVPGPGYISRVLIGEIIDEKGKFGRTQTEQYLNDRVLSKRIRWLTKEFPKWRYSDRLINLLQNPNALIKAPFLVRTEIYDTAFDAYIVPGNSSVAEFDVSREEIDYWDFIQSQELLAYFVAMYSALENKNDEFFELDINSATRKYYNQLFITGMAVAVSSPGALTLRSNKLGVPLFITIMLALSGVQPNEALGQEIEIAHQDAGMRDDVDDCVLKVQGDINEVLRKFQAERWQEICERRRQARDNVGMQGEADVRIDDRNRR